MTPRIPVLLALIAVGISMAAQETVPSPARYLGYEIGERFTPHARIAGYFEELARTSELVTLRQIGETYEHRPLLLATITAPKHHARLEEIRRNIESLAAGEGDAVARSGSTPAVVWLAFGVHGNESSSAEAAMLVAHALATDPQYASLLEDLVVIIDPLLNPDGRDRYVEWYRRARGAKPDANPVAFEHTEPWPGGRYNHYLIDMNRDWAWLTQRETQARVAAYREWNPQVFVDLHEMGYESTYFFPPSANPLNANLPREIVAWLERFGRANAAAFSERGWPFFIGETFDLFYPGYGDSWPSLRGAIGMTYEMAGGGRAGSVVRRRDGTLLTLRARAERHFTAAMATLQTAAQHRDALLRYTHASAQNQMRSGRNTFLLLPDSPGFPALLSILERQGIRVEMLSQPVTLRATRVDREVTQSRTFPAGTAVVSTRQPLGRLANTLLERSPVFSEGFLERQRQKADEDDPDDFYDLTAWSLPIAMDVEAWATTASVASVPYAAAPAPAFRAARYGYLISGRDPNVYRAAGRMLEVGINFSVASNDLPAGERTYPRGSLVVLRSNNGERLETGLESIATATGAQFVPLESGWIGDASFGSDRLRHVVAPKIAIIGGPESDPSSFGMLWFTLDLDTPLPHTRLATEALGRADLREFRVLVFPNGDFSTIPSKTIEKIKRWVEDGGTIVAIKGGSTVLRVKDLEISKLKLWEPPKREGEDAPVEERYNDFRIPGSAFRTVVNERSYLTFGVTDPPAVLVEGTRAFVPLARRVDNVVTIESTDPLISGVAWKESLERLKGAPYLVAEPLGRGKVITFADEPHFRLFWRGTLPLLLNAVLYSPSFTR